MRILLTGASGFLGSALQNSLRGHTVVTTDRRGSVDLAGDLAEREFASLLPDVDTVVHTAAVQYVSGDLPLLARHEYFERNNVVATQNLCRRFAGRGVHFVNVGTSMMYRQSGAANYRVDSPMDGQGVYSCSKLAAQRMLEMHIDHWATIIPCIIGGPGREGLFRGFVRTMQQWRCVAFPGTGEHPIQMVHVDDVASLVTIAVETKAAGFLNAGGPQPLSIVEWVDLVASELGISSVHTLRVPIKLVQMLASMTRYRLLAREQLLMLMQPHVLDISRSLALGWCPQRTNARVVREIARHIADSPLGSERSP
jgi:nucleoside-diphosphate-sugar epimerase